MILPNGPSGLGSEWVRDMRNLDPNGSLWRDGANNTLEFNQGRPGFNRWKGENHWHYNGDHSKPGHLRPGAEIPDPVPRPVAPKPFGPATGAAALRFGGYIGAFFMLLNLSDTPNPPTGN